MVFLFLKYIAAEAINTIIKTHDPIIINTGIISLTPLEKLLVPD